MALVGNVILQPITSSGSLVDGINLRITTPGTLLIDGTNSPAKLLASGTVSISADAVSVNAGRFSGSINPAFLNLTATGIPVIQGGSTSSGVATVAANTVNITASNIVIQGGSSTGSYAGIIGGTGSSTGTVVNNITDRAS